MKIILSRKGSDGTKLGGQMPSFIFEDKFISMPIPEMGTKISYDSISFNENYTMGKVLQDLGKNFHEAHLDPDLRKSALENRPNNWRATFGQVDQSQSFLRNKAVSVGDLFLFYGWYKKLEFKNSRFQFDKKAPDVQVIWGYLEIEKTKVVLNDKLPEWLSYHPHITMKDKFSTNNTVYIATKKLSFDTLKAGAGMFRYSKELVLTKYGHTRSVWRVPKIFEHVKKSFTGKVDFYEIPEEDNFLEMRLVGRCLQEFLVTDDMNIVDWAKKLICNNATYF